MKKSQEYELRKRIGDLNALCGIKRYTFNDGLEQGVRAFDLKNGRGVEMTVLADRGLDIPYFSYKGINVGFISKTGISAPQFYVENGAEGFLKRFFGGLLTTGGITYAGAACVDGDRALGLHGPYDNTPAERVRAWTDYEDDEALLHVAGQVREARVFGENMRLERTLTLRTEQNQLLIHDEVENLGFEPQPVMVLYHINFGYPLLDEGARVYSSAMDVQARNDFAQSGMDKFDLIEAPEIGREEQCYFHTRNADPAHAFAMLHNARLGLAAVVRYDANQLPQLCQWKCMRAGEYVLGLEPTSAGVLSRLEARELGMVKTLEGGQKRAFDVTIEITQDQSVIEGYISRAVKRR